MRRCKIVYENKIIHEEVYFHKWFGSGPENIVGIVELPSGMIETYYPGIIIFIDPPEEKEIRIEKMVSDIHREVIGIAGEIIFPDDYAFPAALRDRLEELTERELIEGDIDENWLYLWRFYTNGIQKILVDKRNNEKKKKLVSYTPYSRVTEEVVSELEEIGRKQDDLLL